MIRLGASLLLVATLAWAQPGPTTTVISGKKALDVNCVNGCSAAAGATSVNVLDAGVLNVAAMQSGTWSTRLTDGTDTANVTAALRLEVDPSGVTSPVSITAGNFPDNEPFNLNQLASNAVSTGVGASGTGTLRTAALLHDGTDTALVTTAGSLQADLFSLAGNAVSTGVGASGTGTQRTAALIHDGTTTAGVIVGTTALKTDTSSIAGTATSTGVGASGAGVQRVASLLHDGTDTLLVTTAGAAQADVFSVSGTAVSTAAAGVMKVGVVGNANGAFDAANNAAAPANVLAAGAETATQTTTQPTAATTGNVRRIVAGTDGVLYSRAGGPVQWQCNLGAVGTTLTECKAAPGASLRLYITDIIAVSTTTTSGLFTLRFGTGANCGTGTGNLFFASAAATIPNRPNNAVAGPQSLSFITPIAVTANNAVCVLGVVTNTTNIQISGYTAP